MKKIMGWLGYISKRDILIYGLKCATEYHNRANKSLEAQKGDSPEKLKENLRQWEINAEQGMAIYKFVNNINDANL